MCSHIETMLRMVKIHVVLVGLLWSHQFLPAQSPAVGGNEGGHLNMVMVATDLSQPEALAVTNRLFVAPKLLMSDFSVKDRPWVYMATYLNLQQNTMTTINDNVGWVIDLKEMPLPKNSGSSNNPYGLPSVMTNVFLDVETPPSNINGKLCHRWVKHVNDQTNLPVEIEFWSTEDKALVKALDEFYESRMAGLSRVFKPPYISTNNLVPISTTFMQEDRPTRNYSYLQLSISPPPQKVFDLPKKVNVGKPKLPPRMRTMTATNAPADSSLPNQTRQGKSGN